MNYRQVHKRSVSLVDPWYDGVIHTDSRVPDRPTFGMGRNDRLGIKPICTHITDKIGMAPPDCIPNPYASGSASNRNPENYILPDYDAGAAFRDYGMDKPFNGMLSDDCEQVPSPVHLLGIYFLPLTVLFFCLGGSRLATHAARAS